MKTTRCFAASVAIADRTLPSRTADARAHRMAARCVLGAIECSRAGGRPEVHFD
jgi:hypothetical protein